MIGSLFLSSKKRDFYDNFQIFKNAATHLACHGQNVMSHDRPSYNRKHGKRSCEKCTALTARYLLVD